MGAAVAKIMKNRTFEKVGFSTHRYFWAALSAGMAPFVFFLDSLGPGLHFGGFYSLVALVVEAVEFFFVKSTGGEKRHFGAGLGGPHGPVKIGIFRKFFSAPKC